MKQILAIALVLVLGTGVLVAQEQTRQTETRMIIKQEKEREGFYTIRFGAWWPEDKEKEFRIGENIYDQTDAQIEQSQALGLDFHFRKMMTHPMYFDVSAGAWYTSYTFDFKEAVSNIGEEFENFDAWAVIVPVTLGLSIAPLPAESPVQPYAMAGLGAYVGITGRDKLLVSNDNRSDDTKTYVRFGWYFGGGLDFLFADTFGISLGAKYQFLEFQDVLYTQQKNFTGLQGTLGIVMVL
ncbi:MAG: outer membrane beta-barrel protein [Bacteroidetes bacterium]|nr:outer membrane beta-barrel protein [Bacteroidota bacterium]